MIKSIEFYFDQDSSKSIYTQQVSFLTDYKLYVYLNKTKYYVDISRFRHYYSEWINLELRSTENKNMVEGSRIF